MSDFLNKKLRVLAAILRERGLSGESDRVYSMLDGVLLLKGAASKEDEKADKLKIELKNITETSEETSEETPGSFLSVPLPSGSKKEKTEGFLDIPLPSGSKKEKKEKTEGFLAIPGSPEAKKSYDDESQPIDEGLILKVKTKDKSAVRRLQKALVGAGFDLPRFGVDGLFGKETKSAVVAFKEKAAAEGKYSGEINGTVDKSTLELIESWQTRKPGYIFDTESNLKKDGGTLYVGDSQMVGSIGRALMGAGGSGEKLAKSGTQASYWAKNPKLIKALKKGPSKIIISLNGNGTDGTGALIKTILKYTDSDTKVIWSGAPPPIRKAKGSTWAKYLTSDEGFARAYKKRSDFNTEDVAPLMPDGWVFINPYTHIKYDKPEAIGGTSYVSGYTCTKCDGIHVPSQVANNYVSSIKGLLA
jgi:hypothetical protein